MHNAETGEWWLFSMIKEWSGLHVHQAGSEMRDGLYKGRRKSWVIPRSQLFLAIHVNLASFPLTSSCLLPCCREETQFLYLLVSLALALRNVYSGCKGISGDLEKETLL